MHGARAARARGFAQIFSMHRARAARARGFDSLPSLSDVGTFTALAFDRPREQIIGRRSHSAFVRV